MPEHPGGPLSVGPGDSRQSILNGNPPAPRHLRHGDKDLLSVAEHAPLPIVDPWGCWDRLRRAR